MGEKDSSLTRLQTCFDELLDRWPAGDHWLGSLWDLAAQTRPGAALPRPADLGTLASSETPSDRVGRMGKVYERTVAPPAFFLRWLLMNPQALQVRDTTMFGAKSIEAREWRAKLFSGDERLVREAQAEGIKQLEGRLGARGRNKWWAFEGFSHIDCCLITDTCVVFVAGKRTEVVSPSTFWFLKRSQLWRNVEAAKEFAGSRQFAVILAVENEVDGTSALSDAAVSLSESYPHLDADQQGELSRHLIGFVTWSELADVLQSLVEARQMNLDPASST